MIDFTRSDCMVVPFDYVRPMPNYHGRRKKRRALGQCVSSGQSAYRYSRQWPGHIIPRRRRLLHSTVRLFCPRRELFKELHTAGVSLKHLYSMCTHRSLKSLVRYCPRPTLSPRTRSVVPHTHRYRLSSCFLRYWHRDIGKLVLCCGEQMASIYVIVFQTV